MSLMMNEVPLTPLVRRLHPASWWVALFVLLWPTDIGPEFPEPLAPETPPAEPEPPPRKKGGPQAKDRSSLPDFATLHDAPIDREAFIQSFRRQARAEALPCLLQWKPSPASLHVAATLLKASGRLKNLRAVGPEAQTPDCLAPAVYKMDFGPLALPLTADGQELQWRIDW